MSIPQVHVINHTHWDREWFLTSIYTSRWIPGLIERLEALAAANSEFTYLLDGQTLVVEDLLELAPDYEARVRRLVERGNLLCGPYYCQPDWQTAGGEALMRNLELGLADVRRLGGEADTGWLVDTFGHISQSPQMHRLAGIGQVFVWRGAPLLSPYFLWQSPDGSDVLAVYLLGGYRNLYGVSHAPEVAVQRLETEVERLKPYHPTPEIPLFDGYDLEDNPEDPLRFYQELGYSPTHLTLVQSSPAQFVEAVRARGLHLPTVQHELNSGKYGATFPGTLSARIYLKLMAHDCDRLLYRVCEPLAVLASACGRDYPAEQYESWARTLLQNAVHDGICGVSIDEVHEKMEALYRRVFDGARADIVASLEALLASFQSGDYAVSLSPIPGEAYIPLGDSIAYTHTSGVGVFPVQANAIIERPNQTTETFRWSNQHYNAEIDADGLIRIGEGVFGRLTVRIENGDAYSEESGALLGTLAPLAPPVILEKSRWHTVVGYTASWELGDEWAAASIQVHFDPTPIVRWTIEIDSRGANLRVDLHCKAWAGSEIAAGMPFDFVQRSGIDHDLLPRQPDSDLASILLGQRELNAVRTFAFQDTLALTKNEQSLAIFASGLRAYTLDDAGEVRLPLRRSVEWLTRPGLQDRVGDAGPFFYVPEARCERRERHELGLTVGKFTPDSLELAALNERFHHPPLLLRSDNGGRQRQRVFFQEELPMSSLRLQNGRTIARIFNPTRQPKSLSRAYPQVNLWGQPEGEIEVVGPKKIAMIELAQSESPSPPSGRRAELLNPPAWRVGENTTRPDPAVVALLSEKAAALEQELAQVTAELAEVEGARRLTLQHRGYVLEREMVEYLFSELLNERRLARSGPPSEADLFQPDPEIAALGLRLNKLRIKRRIFDYVVGVLKV